MEKYAVLSGRWPLRYDWTAVKCELTHQ